MADYIVSIRYTNNRESTVTVTANSDEEALGLGLEKWNDHSNEHIIDYTVFTRSELLKRVISRSSSP